MTNNKNELIVDLFAGGGGASTGMEQAAGRSVDHAVNHDPEALGMHQINHPQTRHHCTDIFEIDPLAVTNGQPVGILWASPDCKHFSKAKGGRPVSKKIRSLAWVVIRWARAVKPRLIFVENVEEFKTWGPLKGNQPDPTKKGTTFARWVYMLKRLGYQVAWRELRACDYGAPTIRKRLFIIARCDGRPIVWPEPTHGDPKDPQTKAKGLLPWRTAADCIDWSLSCPSIFERKKELSPNTLRRIARGIVKYVINSNEPYIVPAHSDGGAVAPHIVSIANWSGQSVRAGNAPLSTVTANPKGGHHALVCATIATNTTGHPGAPADEPLRTITTGGHHAVVTPILAPFIAGNGGPTYSAKPTRADKPIGTVTTINHKCVVVPVLAQVGYGEAEGQQPRVTPPVKPLWTVVSGGNHAALVSAFVAKHYTGAVGSNPQDPMGTVTAIDHIGLVTVHIKGEPHVITDIGMRMLQPKELYAAQGFPPDYVYDHTAAGVISKAGQVRMCGNAVCPPLARALVRANYTEASNETKHH